jgi:hypothetical protein
MKRLTHEVLITPTKEQLVRVCEVLGLDPDEASAITLQAEGEGISTAVVLNWDAIHDGIVNLDDVE